MFQEHHILTVIANSDTPLPFSQTFIEFKSFSSQLSLRFNFRSSITPSSVGSLVFCLRGVKGFGRSWIAFFWVVGVVQHDARVWPSRTNARSNNLLEYRFILQNVQYKNGYKRRISAWKNNDFRPLKLKVFFNAWRKLPPSAFMIHPRWCEVKRRWGNCRVWATWLAWVFCLVPNPLAFFFACDVKVIHFCRDIPDGFKIWE